MEREVYMAENGTGMAGHGTDMTESGVDITGRSMNAAESGADRAGRSMNAAESGADRAGRSMDAAESGADRAGQSMDAAESVADQTAAEQEISPAEQLQSMVLLLEEYAKPLISEDETKLSIIMPRLVQVMNLIFPMVIRDYALPAFADRQDEISTWVQLLSGITQTLEGRDTFAKVDMIYSVLRPNLIEHIAILQGQDGGLDA
ncbi:MAG: hypothetical protein NC254_10605 [bacterium]|nr:hypothetical protein [bacterium]